MLGSIVQSLFSLMDGYMLPYQEVFHVQLHGCWLNLTKILIPPAKEPKILFSEIFYGLQNEGIPAEEPKILFSEIFYGLQNEDISYDVSFFNVDVVGYH